MCNAQHLQPGSKAPAHALTEGIHSIATVHRPSRMPFFARLAAMPYDVASGAEFLGQLHLIYQSAMHATRAAVYRLPHLESPALRRRKLQIFIDDDGLAGGDTHHYQLTRAFRAMGARCVLEDEAFGDIDDLCRHLDPATAAFARLADRLYARSLGAWCVVEIMSDDWMRALADALSVHFPSIKSEPYFADCFAQGVEERHAAEAVEITQMIVAERPHLLTPTLEDARTMAVGLDGVWTTLDGIVTRALGTMLRSHSNRWRTVSRRAANGTVEHDAAARAPTPLEVHTA